MAWRRHLDLAAPAVLCGMLLVGLAALAFLFGSRLVQHSLTEMLVMVVVVVGTSIFVGNSGILSFGHISFMAIGAYASAWLTLPLGLKRLNMPGLPSFLHQLSLPVTLSAVLSGLLAALVALAVGISILRLSGIGASIATLAFLMVVSVGYANWDSVTLGTSSIVGLPSYTGLGTALAWAVGALAAAHLYQVSRHGLMLRASRDNEIAAQAAGVNVVFERLIAFVISAFVVAVGGVLYGHFLGTISVDAFYLNLTFTSLAMLVVGGMGSLSGAVLGVVSLSLLIEALRQVEKGVEVSGLLLSLPPGSQEIGIAATMLVVLILRPKGLTNNKELRWPSLWPAPAGRGLVAR
jgi:branched-chain amino acid transport system permease protein